jgi:hypothetical protein
MHRHITYLIFSILQWLGISVSLPADWLVAVGQSCVGDAGGRPTLVAQPSCYADRRMSEELTIISIRDEIVQSSHGDLEKHLGYFILVA